MTEEQATNDQSAQTKMPRAYERSTIEFPYNDLGDAIEVVRAIHSNAGTGCTLDQLAAYMRQSMTSGAFRGRVANAGAFHLTDNERGEVKLTELGRRIVEPAREPAAKVEAFMSVPLYERVFEHFKGYTLPPPAALERFMNEVGVATKQTDKARQAFMRSARQAGFFEHGEDRLVRPITADSGPGTKPIEAATPGAMEKRPEELSKRTGGGGDGPDLSGFHPFIQGLLKTLPAPETDWDVMARAKWLQTAANIFDLIYKGEGGIKIEAALAQRSPRPE
ncbi:MAG: hypothetical protein ACHP84_16300 [Caulobacterales bacterium]